MSSLSNPGWGCDPSQKRRAVCSRPTRPGLCWRGRRPVGMARLADTVDGVIGVDTHRDTLAAAATDPVGGRARPDLGQRRRGRLPSAAGLRPGAGARAALLGGGGCRQLRRRAGRVPAGPRRAGGGGRPAQAARRGVPAPRATPWTPSARPGRRSPTIILLAPRRRGDREALRVLLATRHSACVAKVSAINQLKALIVGAPEELRAELRGAGDQAPDRRAAYGCGTGRPGRWSTA